MHTWEVRIQREDKEQRWRRKAGGMDIKTRKKSTGCKVRWRGRWWEDVLTICGQKRNTEIYYKFGKNGRNLQSPDKNERAWGKCHNRRIEVWKKEEKLALRKQSSDNTRGWLVRTNRTCINHRKIAETYRDRSTTLSETARLTRSRLQLYSWNKWAWQVDLECVSYLVMEASEQHVKYRASIITI